MGGDRRDHPSADYLRHSRAITLPRMMAQAHSWSPSHVRVRLIAKRVCGFAVVLSEKIFEFVLELILARAF